MLLVAVTQPPKDLPQGRALNASHSPLAFPTVLPHREQSFAFHPLHFTDVEIKAVGLL